MKRKTKCIVETESMEEVLPELVVLNPAPKKRAYKKAASKQVILKSDEDSNSFSTTTDTQDTIISTTPAITAIENKTASNQNSSNPQTPSQPAISSSSLKQAVASVVTTLASSQKQKQETLVNEKEDDDEIALSHDIAKPQEIFDCKYHPDSISFRDKEKNEIKSFITRCVKAQQRCKCLLISGMPGCGKTLTTLAVLQELAKGDFVELIKFNAMNFSTQASFLSHLYVKLFKKDSANPADDLVDHCKKAALTRTKPLVLFIDEFDNLFQQKSKEIFVLFDMANNIDCEVILIGVSNSMEMLFELSKRHHVSLHEMKNIVFEPYSQKEIYSIIVSRLTEMKKKLSIEESKAIIDDRALRLCSGKMYNLKGGDIRCLFDVCKKALEQSSTDESTTMISSSSSSESQSQSISCRDVSLPQLNAIIDKLYRVDYSFIGGMPTEQQLAVIAIYEVLKGDDSLVEIGMAMVKKQFGLICKRMSLEIDEKKIYEILENLQSYEIILIRNKDATGNPATTKKKTGPKTNQKSQQDTATVFLKITTQDIEQAFENNPKFEGIIFKKDQIDGNQSDNDAETA